ncbi:histidinol-phosphate transaminase [Mesorhizobium sp. CO1-1-11]|uniref:histidinol-phosphate transaminase n=1 Tax=Mesorhizobium sp. CO1-1-11 TaxID=2876636 RepID=UPI001CCB285F|nr:histidinol-phosphate transaminase [Mesorhizobium sp. CO1-1-11]MBZ9726311.1 histidinol-phosphate transaminase [Mesorhizobium sp. CO1-1-11]
MSLTVRPGIEQIVGYVPGEARSPANTRPLRLASNELPFGPSKAVKSAASAICAVANRYPDGGAVLLREQIGRLHRLEVDRVLAGSGSEELLQLVCRAFAKDGDEVLSSQYGFMMYPIIARSVGATPTFAEERDFHVDVRAMLAAVTPATRVVFLTNPANPAGTYVPRSDLELLIRELPSDVVLVIDEAYAEFVDAPDFASALPYAREASNVVVTRTFSKIFGLGGLRVGWAYAPREVVEAVNKIRLPFNVSAVGQAAAIAAMHEPDHVQRTRAYIRQAREWTSERLLKLGLQVAPSVTSFILVGFPTGCPGTAAEAVVDLRSSGILVRPLGAYGLHNHIRITIGAHSDMRRVAARLASYLKRAARK